MHGTGVKMTFRNFHKDCVKQFQVTQFRDYTVLKKSEMNNNIFETRSEVFLTVMKV